jgi:hypothetical protein
LTAAQPAFVLDQSDSLTEVANVQTLHLGGQAAACRQHANQIMDTETQQKLREMAAKFIVRAVEIESKELGRQ